MEQNQEPSIFSMLRALEALPLPDEAKQMMLQGFTAVDQDEQAQNAKEFSEVHNKLDRIYEFLVTLERKLDGQE